MLRSAPPPTSGGASPAPPQTTHPRASHRRSGRERIQPLRPRRSPPSSAAPLQSPEGRRALIIRSAAGATPPSATPPPAARRPPPRKDGRLEVACASGGGIQQSGTGMARTFLKARPDRPRPAHRNPRLETPVPTEHPQKTPLRADPSTGRFPLAPESGSPHQSARRSEAHPPIPARTGDVPDFRKLQRRIVDGGPPPLLRRIAPLERAPKRRRTAPCFQGSRFLPFSTPFANSLRRPVWKGLKNLVFSPLFPLSRLSVVKHRSKRGTQARSHSPPGGGTGKAGGLFESVEHRWTYQGLRTTGTLASWVIEKPTPLLIPSFCKRTP